MTGITVIKRIGSKLKPNRIALYFCLIMVVFASVFASSAFSRSWAAMKMQEQQAIDESGGYTENSEIISEQPLPEPARYNLASVQTFYTLRAETGDQAIGQLYFYNVDGNRATHINLEVVEAPKGIEVQFAPGQYLVVEPTDIYTEPIVTVPSGMTSLALPNRIDDGVNGYCLVHVVDIVVNVTEEAALGNVGTVELLATGSWPGQTGQAQICQSRSFKFDVEVAQ